jgi:hypothetical protein
MGSWTGGKQSHGMDINEGFLIPMLKLLCKRWIASE